MRRGVGAQRGRGVAAGPPFAAFPSSLHSSSSSFAAGAAARGRGAAGPPFASLPSSPHSFSFAAAAAA